MPVDRRIDGLVAILIDMTQNFDKPVTAELLWGWQAALFPSGYSGMHSVKVGGWRETLGAGSTRRIGDYVQS